MATYTPQKKAEIVMLFAKNQESYTDTRREFQTTYKTKEFPTFKSLKNWVQNFLTTGSVGRAVVKKGLAKVEEVKEEVASIIKTKPKTSVRRLSAMTGSSIFTVWRALKAMKFHSYRMLSVQKLEACDYEKRRNFCMEELENIDVDPNCLMNLMFSDETHFHLDGGVNRHNCRMWSVENPRWFEELPIHSSRVTVWGAMSSDRVIGPYFFEGTVTGDSYLNLLETQF